MRKFLAYKLTTLVTAITLCLGLAAPLASAQTSAAQQQINAGVCAGANFNVTSEPSISECNTNGDATQQINNIIHNIVNFLSVLVGIVAVIMIIIGGFRYITSGGNDTSVTSAKNTILYAIVGLIIVALAQLIVNFTLGRLTTATG